MKQQPEYSLQKQVTAYLRLQYPQTLFMSDTIAAVRLTIPQQVRNKSIQKSDFHCPDLIIFEPKGCFHALFIELKAKSPYKKSGELLKDQHLEDQQETIYDLNSLGYYAQFAWTFEMAKEIIDNYMNLK